MSRYQTFSTNDSDRIIRFIHSSPRRIRVPRSRFLKRGKRSSEVISWISLVRFHSWLLVAGYFLQGTRLRFRITLLLVTWTSRSRILWSHRFVSGWCVSGAARRCPISTFAWIDTTMEKRRPGIWSPDHIYQRVFSADIVVLKWERKKAKDRQKWSFEKKIYYWTRKERLIVVSLSHARYSFSVTCDGYPQQDENSVGFRLLSGQQPCVFKKSIAQDTGLVLKYYALPTCQLEPLCRENYTSLFPQITCQEDGRFSRPRAICYPSG